MVQPLGATTASKPKFYYIVYKKIFKKFQILQKKKNQKFRFKTSERPKNIKEKLSTFEFEFKLDLLER